MFYKLTQIVLFILYKLFFRFKSFGAENVPSDSRGVVLAPNHASYLDPPLLGISLREPVTYLAKDYLFKRKGLGVMLGWLNVLPIRTEVQDFKSIRQLLKALNAGKHVAVFPEGTRSPDGQPQEVEGGVGFLALKSRSHVVPVYIRGSFEALPRDAKWFRCVPIEIYFGKAFIPVLDTALTSQEDPNLAVSREIMRRIAELKEKAQV